MKNIHCQTTVPPFKQQDDINPINLPDQKESYDLENPRVSPKRTLKKKRCFECNKRLNLLPITCKCGVVTCIQHKWPDHDCTYDYRAEATEHLIKNNPVVVATKLNRI